MLSLGELEVVRDELAERLREARATITRRADEQAEKRLLLERMLLEPGRYRFTRRVAARTWASPAAASGRFARGWA